MLRAGPRGFTGQQAIGESLDEYHGGLDDKINLNESKGKGRKGGVLPVP